jgi:hypothetical protein
VIKSRRIRWVWHVEHKEEERCIKDFDEERERDQSENPDVDGRIIFRWIFRRAVWGNDWIDLAWHRDSWRALANAAITLLVQ